jgi:hypothetical protein
MSDLNKAIAYDFIRAAVLLDKADPSPAEVVRAVRAMVCRHSKLQPSKRGSRRHPSRAGRTEPVPSI